MRVIAGTAKGHVLKVPRLPVRPTTGMVRGAIFAILGARLEGAQVLDLYAGSGALGIEALSRGAAWVDFVEQQPRCCAIIKQNLEAASLEAQGHVYCCKASRALTFLSKQYNLVLVDPPYADLSLDRMLTQLADSSVVKLTTILVVTHSSRRQLSFSYGPFKLARKRSQGDTCVSFFQGEASL